MDEEPDDHYLGFCDPETCDACIEDNPAPGCGDRKAKTAARKSAERHTPKEPIIDRFEPISTTETKATETAPEKPAQGGGCRHQGSPQP